jgi:hypothetical protein
VNCPTASAKLMATMPNPVAVLSGEMNSPSDCRAPIVIVRMAAATSTRGQCDGGRAAPGRIVDLRI